MRNVEVVHESSYDGGFGVEVVRSLRIQKLHLASLYRSLVWVSRPFLQFWYFADAAIATGSPTTECRIDSRSGAPVFFNKADPGRHGGLRVLLPWPVAQRQKPIEGFLFPKAVGVHQFTRT